MNVNARLNEGQYGVVRAVNMDPQYVGNIREAPIDPMDSRKKLHPQKRFFADNLHHKS